MADAIGGFRRWLLFDGNRYAVAGGVLVVVFLSLVGLGRLGVIGVDDPDAVRGIAGGLVPGLFTFLSIVLAINQLVLTQEFGSAEELEDRMRGIEAFRDEVEDVAAADPSPVVPTAFLGVLVDAVTARAQALDAQVGDVGSAEARAELDALATTATAEARRARIALEASDPGRINAILSVLEYPATEHRHRARRVGSDFEADLPPETRRTLSELVEVLELFGVARTHFRTTYTQRVLARLSRLLLYVGIPALLVSFVLHLLVPSWPLPAYRLVVVSALLAAALAPLAVLFAYILRVAAVSERTITVGPFLSRPGNSSRMRAGRGTRSDRTSSGREADSGDGTAAGDVQPDPTSADGADDEPTER